jgi:hypothetical protein
VIPGNESTGDQRNAEEVRRSSDARISAGQIRALNSAGLLFVYAGLLTLVVAVGLSIWIVVENALPSGAADFFTTYGLPLVLVAAATLFSIVGYLILRSVGTANRQVIPAEDRTLLEHLILEKDEYGGFEKYVTLSGLSGVTGFFHKIGVSGLPLATIFLTLVFALLALTNAGGQAGAFTDLANLGLGAFLGSFVQRQAMPGEQPTASFQGFTDPGPNPANPNPQGPAAPPTATLASSASGRTPSGPELSMSGEVEREPDEAALPRLVSFPTPLRVNVGDREAQAIAMFVTEEANEAKTRYLVGSPGRQLVWIDDDDVTWPSAS